MSKEIEKAISSYESYIKNRGIDKSVVDAYFQVTFWANEKDNDIKTALQVSKRTKELMNQYTINGAGGDMWELEKFCFQNKTGHEILDKYYQILKFEAQNKILDSYLLYLEKNRIPRERFYAPKRKQFAKFGLIDAYQGAIDDIYDIICISMPPGTGKALSMDSKILAPRGFVKNSELKVGDEVIAGNGNISKVLGIYPQGKKPLYEIALENGFKCICSKDHLWKVRYNYFGNKTKEKVIELNEIMLNPHKYLIPVTTKNLNGIFYLRIGAIRYVGDEECQCIYIDDDSHLYITDDFIVTHNTTLLKFFNSAVIGWFPKDYNLFYSHSGDITRMYYDGVYQMVTDSQEYTWNEIFPDLSVTSTNAKMQQFNIGSYKPFPSLQTASVGSENAGKVRASKFLLIDDMIGKLEEALNKNTLDKLWGAYTVDARQRKTMDFDENPCKEVLQATRWSTMDIVGRVIKMYQGNPRVKIISMPDIDPVTHESNFDYEFGGFTVAFFNDQALLMDEISYKCLYKQRPVEREGLLFPDAKVRRYEKLPDGRPDEILGQCDTKGKGTDYFVLPCLYRYGEDFYCVDCVCDNTADYEKQYENSANLIVHHRMNNCEFESNAGGDRVAMEVNKRVEEKGWICNITSVPTESNKEARIYQCSSWVLQHIVFKDKSLYTQKDQYGVMMSLLLGYSVSNAKQLDDVPDVFSNFALRMTRKTKTARAEAIQNPFRTGGHGYSF